MLCPIALAHTHPHIASSSDRIRKPHAPLYPRPRAHALSTPHMHTRLSLSLSFSLLDKTTCSAKIPLSGGTYTPLREGVRVYRAGVASGGRRSGGRKTRERARAHTRGTRG